MDDLYQELLLDHYKHPRQRQEIPRPTHEGKATNHSCGDEVELHIQIENGTIEKISWKGQGCVMSQAVSSLLAEKVKGATLAQVQQMGLIDVEEMLDTKISPGRIKCATLFLRCLNEIQPLGKK